MLRAISSCEAAMITADKIVRPFGRLGSRYRVNRRGFYAHYAGRYMAFALIPLFLVVDRLEVSRDYKYIALIAAILVGHCLTAYTVENGSRIQAEDPPL